MDRSRQFTRRRIPDRVNPATRQGGIAGTTPSITLSRRRVIPPVTVAIAILAAAILGGCAAPPTRAADDIVISIVGTNDVHGELLPRVGRGGLVTIAGYVNALRSVRDDGAVLLIDAGDMWQGTLDSNLNEGAAVVAAYNAMGYVAAAIGNHEFDFGPLGEASSPRDAADDAHGALRRRATEARFPLLAANLIDASDARSVNWQNVVPSISVDAAGIEVGIIGVMTESALEATFAANTAGLSIAPLAESVRREAETLRAAGAALIVVAAHAGGRCHGFSDPHDLSSCEMDTEIMRLAHALPRGLVDHIIGGHVHQGIAHVVNGIAITSAYSSTYAFSRVDFTMHARTSEVVSRKVFPPQIACPYRRVDDGSCRWRQSGGDSPARYEGRTVTADDAVLAIALRAEKAANAMKQKQLGTRLETPFTLKGNPESALGNLVTDAILDSIGGDIAIHNVSGGIRAVLPAGELTYGAVYEMYPFDNRTVVLDLSGLELRKVIAAQAMKSRRRAGFSGMTVAVRCENGAMAVEMRRPGGELISDTDRLNVVVNDFLALGGDNILTPAMPPGGFRYDYDAGLPTTRDLLVRWLRDRGTLRAEDFLTGDAPKWHTPPELPASCRP